MAQYKAEAGEIWECETRNGTIYEMLVLKRNENYSTGLRLYDEKTDNCVEVQAMTIKYADVGRPVYSFNDMMVRFVKAVKKNDMDRIKKQMAECLGINIGYTEEELNNAIEEEKEKWEAAIPKSTEKCGSDEAQQMEVLKYKTRAEIFESLYKELLAKVTA